MPWSEETNAALRSWLEPETWFRRRSADQRQFYVFIAHVWNERRTVWDEDTAREAILAIGWRIDSLCSTMTEPCF